LLVDGETIRVLESRGNNRQMAIRISREDEPLRLFPHQLFGGDVENPIVTDGEPLRLFETLDQRQDPAIRKELERPACLLLRKVQDVIGIDGEESGIS